MRRLLPLWLVALSASTALGQPSLPPADPYKPAVERLTAEIEREVQAKRLPALSVALIDDGRIVWAAGFGHRDKARTAPATAETVYRVGSVSKLFTDVAVMKLVEAGTLDLDAPVTKYLPDFKPKNPFNDTPITLRHLMAHRSGLVREPPVGNYFDPTGPTLAATVASLNGTTLVYPPGEKTKYSNAAIGVVGRVLEVVSKKPFAEAVKAAALDPLGMTASAFEPTPGVRQHLADAVMWTYHGREFPAPTFELGMAPAGSMYSSVLDLSKFAACLMADGRGLLKPESLAEMLRPQFAKPDETTGFGIGFVLGDLDGKKRIGHGGAIYGFATELAVLPSEKLGMVVVTSRDVANAVITHLANDALKLMLAAKAGTPLPDLPETVPVGEGLARQLAGVYRDGDRWLDVTELGGRAYLTPGRGGARVELRKLGPDLYCDDITGWGPKLTRDGDKLTVNGKTYTKEPDHGPPPAPPRKWLGLIGEYGWDHNTLFIYEKAGKLHALIEWEEVDPLTEESADVYAFPADRGMYHGEKLVFTRDGSGRATKVVVAGITFDRRKIDGENGETFRVVPQRPVADLRAAALAATPPKEDRERKPDLVDLATVDPGIRFDIRYATDNNFLSTPFYTLPKAYMQRPAAEALGLVHRELTKTGYGLLIHDAYRPWAVTKMFWDATPEKSRGFVADPAKGSKHNRGCAVDLSLYDVATGKPVEMTGGYDEFSDRSYPAYPGGTSRQRWHRDHLRRAMAAQGFAVIDTEWWHFDFKDWPKYPILNKRFEDLAGGKP